MRAVDYGRVSSDMQVEGFSLTAQHTANLALIRGRGWQYIGSYRDEAVSAKTTDRPEFQRMLADARDGRFDVIVVHKLDRFSRSVTDLLLTMRELEQIGVTVVSATEQFDFTTPIGRVLLTLLAAFAQWFLDNLAAETAKGHQARAAEGHWNSAVPYGYYANYKKDGGDGLARVDEQQAAGVRFAFEQYASGQYSDSQMARLMNDKGFRPAGRHGKRSLAFWSKDSIKEVLQNRFYMGEVQYKGEWRKGLHEPIILPETFARCQEVRQSRRVRRGTSQKRTDTIYLMSGIARCASCGLPMRGNFSGQRVRYYSCFAKQRQHVCSAQGKFVRADDAEKALADHLQSIRIPSDWQEQIRIKTEAHLSEQTKQDADAVRTRLQTQLRNLQTMFRLGDIEESEYIAERERLKRELMLLKPPAKNKLAEAADLLINFSDIWNAATPLERRQLVRSLLIEVRLDSEKLVTHIEPHPAFQLLFDITSPG